MLGNWLAQLWAELAAQSLAELIAVVLALGYVWLAARQNIWCWLCAFISTGLYTWIFWEVSLPFNSALNAYYLVMAVYGWWQWRKGDSDGVEMPVQQWPPKTHLIAAIPLLLLSFGLAELAGNWFNGKHVLLDSLVTIFSLYATYLVTRKVIENWLFWIVINAFAAYLYLSSGLMLSGLLFISYIGFAVYGYRQWLASELRQTKALIS